MQYVSRFNLKPKVARQYQAWIKEHAQLLKGGGPQGWTYLGTWFTVHGLGKYQCEVRWEIPNYSALEPMSGSDEYEKAVAEMLDLFVDPQGGEVSLMKSADDVVVMYD